MKRINFALIGCGRIAEKHAELIQKYAYLTAVCDIKPETAILFEKKYKTKAYFNIESLLESEKDIDIVSICTPNGLHSEQTIMCLRAGKHVLCEKPMAINVSSAEKMISESLKANKRLFIVKQNRFNPPVEAIKKAIDENKLGNIYSVQMNCFWNRNNDYYSESDWKGSKKLDGGTLYTQFSHFIDLLYWFLGDIKQLSSVFQNFSHQNNIEFEDTGIVILKFYSGTIGTIHFTINSYNRNMEGSITLFGEKGTVKIGGEYLNKLEYQNIKDFEIKDLPEGNPANFYGSYSGSMSNHDKVYQNVIDVLNNKGIIATNGFEGMKVVEIIERIYNSVSEGF